MLMIRSAIVIVTSTSTLAGLLVWRPRLRDAVFQREIPNAGMDYKRYQGPLRLLDGAQPPSGGQLRRLRLMPDGQWMLDFFSGKGSGFGIYCVGRQQVKAISSGHEADLDEAENIPMIPSN